MRLIALLCLFSLASFAQGLSFSDLGPSPRTINGERFPRKTSILYRGMTEGQYGPKKAVRSMLGDQSSLIESLYFSSIKKELMGESFSMAVSLDANTRREIKAAVQNGNLVESDATKKAKQISDARFNDLKKRGLLEDYYFDYRSSSFIDWPNDVVYSSLIQPAAGTYGHQMALIKEKSPRSLDMNFFNYVENGLWHVYTRDVGEFVSPGYISSEDIIGYQLRDPNGHKGWHRIESFFVKRSLGNEPYIEVYSGEHPYYKTPSSCMTLNGKGEAVHCDYRPGSIALVPPKVTDYKAELMGIISGCESRGSCLSKYKNIVEKAEASSETLKSSLVKDIEGIIGLPLKAHYLSIEEF